MKNKLRSLAALSSVVAGSAMAEVPAAVNTALGDMKTDALAVAGLVLVAVISIYAVKFLRKGL